MSHAISKPGDLVFTGRRNFDGYRIAEPIVKIWDDVAIIDLYGGFDPSTGAALQAACRELVANMAVRSVVLCIDSLAAHGTMGDAVSAVRDMAMIVPVGAFIENAEGAALLVALAAGKVHSQTTAMIGQLGAYVPSLIEERVDPGLTQLAHALRQRVPRASWENLLNHSVNGEQAEALGIVDGLGLCEWNVVRAMNES